MPEPTSSVPPEPVSVAAPGPLPPSAAALGTNLAYWLFYLFFRPRKFFAEYARATPTYAVVICAGIFGMAFGVYCLMNAQSRAMVAALSSSESGAGRVAGYLVGDLFGGALVLGPVWYFLAGTWYGLRLCLCSPQGMGWKLSRRAFIFAELVYALPGIILFTVWYSGGATRFSPVMTAATGLLLAWSTYVSYEASARCSRPHA